MQPSPAALEEVVRLVVRVARPLRVILFGSAARGEMGPDSDIDLLVVVPEGVDLRGTARAIYRATLSLTSDVAVDVVVVTEAILARYGDNGSLVYREALRHGRELYAA